MTAATLRYRMPSGSSGCAALVEPCLVVNEVVDLDVAVQRVAERMPLWASAGITVRPVTWRDQGEGWPPPLKTNRSEVMDADSIGVVLKKGEQEGEVVLFKGGWCDLCLLDR
ncbi:MAG: hypothetical protein ACRDRT_09620 [Pseudonocardiaceae bacterium]